MKTKPFPWKCPHCREKTVYPATVEYAATIEHDGRPYEVKIPAFDVPQCRNCQRLVLVDIANKRVTEALRKKAGLLTAQEIREKRERLGLTQKALADRLQLAVETISRWETGAQIQQRSLDRFLRAFFQFPQLQEYCEELQNDGGVGDETTVSLSSM